MRQTIIIAEVSGIGKGGPLGRVSNAEALDAYITDPKSWVLDRIEMKKNAATASISGFVVRTRRHCDRGDL